MSLFCFHIHNAWNAKPKEKGQMKIYFTSYNYFRNFLSMIAFTWMSNRGLYHVILRFLLVIEFGSVACIWGCNQSHLICVLSCTWLLMDICRTDEILCALCNDCSQSQVPESHLKIDSLLVTQFIIWSPSSPNIFQVSFMLCFTSLRFLQEIPLLSMVLWYHIPTLTSSRCKV